MAKRLIKAGSTSISIDIFIGDSSVTTGAGLTGLVFNSGSLTAYYHRPGSASAAITLATLAAVTTAWSSGGFKEINATQMAGWYRLDIPNVALTSGVTFVGICLMGAANMSPCNIEIELYQAIDGQTWEGALTLIYDACGGGQLAGMGTLTPIIKSADGVTTRATITADTAGNRSAIVIGDLVP